MRQHLTTDTVETVVDAPPDEVYALVSDVTRTPELSPDIVSCRWIDGATGPVVGARFKAVNDGRRMPNWFNKPVVTVADPGREFAFRRTELIGGTLLWRYQLSPEDGGTRVRESYLVEKPVPAVGWFLIGTIYGRKDQAADLRRGMERTLVRIGEVLEAAPTDHGTGTKEGCSSDASAT